MDKNISSYHLQAFLAVAQLGNISKAAKGLHITQPALSMRLKNLEEELECQLFRRGKKGIQLTEAGYRLLKYTRIRTSLEDEFFSQLQSTSRQRSGILRIAGHFSIINHVAIPALAGYLREHSGVSIETIIREDDELPEILLRGQADFVFLQKKLERNEFESVFLGNERYVAIQSRRFRSRNNVFIDSEPSDVITEEFWKLQPQKRPENYERSFLHDEAGILRGVALGLGKAIVAEKEIQPGSGVAVIPGLKPLLIPSYVHYNRQSYYAPIETEARTHLLENTRKFLG